MPGRQLIEDNRKRGKFVPDQPSSSDHLVALSHSIYRAYSAVDPADPQKAEDPGLFIMP
jgi:hypothetical protein